MSFNWPAGNLPSSQHQKQCKLILEFLERISKGDKTVETFLLCYIHCIIGGTPTYQIFLEMYGPGGSGKSTFHLLVTA